MVLQRQFILDKALCYKIFCEKKNKTKQTNKTKIKKTIHLEDERNKVDFNGKNITVTIMLIKRKALSYPQVFSELCTNLYII